MIIFYLCPSIYCSLLTNSALSDAAFPRCSRSPITDRTLLFDFGIIVFYLPCFAHWDLVCWFENNLFRDTTTSSTMWLGHHVKSFSKSNKESDFIFTAEYNDCSSSKLIVLSHRNHCTRSNSSIRGRMITQKWNWGFKLNNVARKCICIVVCLVLWLCHVQKQMQENSTDIESSIHRFSPPNI